MDFFNPVQTEEERRALYKDLGAYWKHGGNPKQPHALLTDKPDRRDHSVGFFNWGEIAQSWYLAREANHDLAFKLGEHVTMDEFHTINRVVGPGHGAISLADRLSEACSIHAGSRIRHGFTQKNGDGSMSARLVKPGDHVLACEDTITSGHSVLEGIRAVERAAGIVFPYIACVCNRSGLDELEGRPIISLLTEDMPCWTAEECPLCKQGSEAIKPKSPSENWARLTAAYD